MAIEHKLGSVFESEEIQDMMFETAEEADEFDKVLKAFITNKEAMKEFNNAEKQYASYAAIQYSINNCSFHFNLKGSHSDDLIAACETCFEVWGDCDHDDPYTPVMNYIFEKHHPGIHEKLFKISWLR